MCCDKKLREYTVILCNGKLARVSADTIEKIEEGIVVFKRNSRIVAEFKSVQGYFEEGVK